jgi:hypothetical protein
MILNIINNITKNEINKIYNTLSSYEDINIFIGDMFRFYIFYSGSASGDIKTVNPKDYTHDFNKIYECNTLFQKVNETRNKLLDAIKDNPEALKVFNVWEEEGSYYPLYSIQIFKGDKIVKSIDNIYSPDIEEKLIENLKQYNIGIV